MPDSPLPLSLFHSDRAQCPDCGAPLSLTAGKPRVDCPYCGGAATVERRLRTFEPSLAQGFVTADGPAISARHDRRSHTVNAVAQDESHCPTCGAALGTSDDRDLQSIRTCGQCGVQSKVERRLVRHEETDAEIEAAIAKADDFERRRFAEVENLLDRIERGRDLPDRVRAAHELGEYWSNVHAGAAKLLPRILTILNRCDDVRIEVPAAEVVGKLLCEGDLRLANAVLRAAERFTFNVNGSRCLLLQLGLGDPICLKLLLDTADYAASHGATEYACTALWAVNQMFERHYGDRMRLAEIVLYRLLYLKGPLQAWAIQLCQGQLGLGCRFDLATILRFIDDCVAERPELLPYARKFFLTPQATTEGEYAERLKRVDELLSAEAKVAALEQLFAPPADASEAFVGKMLARLLELTKDPALATAATKAMCHIVEDGNEPRRSVHDLIAKHRDALPEDVRRAYLRRVPKCDVLSELPVKYWEPEREPPKTAFDQKLDEWNAMWREGIGTAVDAHAERRRAAAVYWAELNGQEYRGA